MTIRARHLPPSPRAVSCTLHPRMCLTNFTLLAHCFSTFHHLPRSFGHPPSSVSLPLPPLSLCSPQKNNEHSARDAELIDFFQNAPIAMHWLNGEGIVLWANQTELNVLGYTAEEYIGKPIMNFCPDERDLVLEIFKQLGSGNAIADVPVRFRTKDGRIVHLLIDSNVAYNRDGSFGHTRCFIRDDTARKVRDARSKLLLEETERVRHTTRMKAGGGGCAKYMLRTFVHLIPRFLLRYTLSPHNTESEDARRLSV